jgi:hypothetical protein
VRRRKSRRRGEEVIDLLQLLLDLAAVERVGSEGGPGQQVFLDRQVAEDRPAFKHLDDAPIDNFVRRQVVDALTLELNRAAGHLALLGVEQAGDSLQGCRLARAIGPQQRNDLPLVDF